MFSVYIGEPFKKRPRGGRDGQNTWNMEDETMLKKLAVLLCVPLLFMAVYHYAFAESIFSEECQARILARNALKENYGLKQHLQAYFEETLVSRENGYTFVYYAGLDDLDYVLGRYTVEVKDGTAKATWSWDGRNVPYAGYGLASNAWGKDQLEEIWLINRQTSNMQNYGLIGRALAAQAGFEAGYISPVPEADDASGDDEPYPEQHEYDPAKAAVSEAEGRKLALSALQEAYGLTDERIAKVRIDEESVWYDMNAAGEPTMDLTCLLWDEDSWQEGNGNYYVTVNLATGKVEALSYLDGVIGNG